MRKRYLIPIILCFAAACVFALHPMITQTTLMWYISLRFNAVVYLIDDGHVAVAFKSDATDQTIDTSIEYLAQLDGLNTVALSSTDISNEGVNLLGALIHLEDVDLSDTQISDKGVAYLTRLPKLRNLQLARTLITDEGVRSLVEIETLRMLNLNDTGVTDMALKPLANAKGLKFLSLVDTKMTTEAIEEFDKSRPKVGVNYRVELPSQSLPTPDEERTPSPQPTNASP